MNTVRVSGSGWEGPETSFESPVSSVYQGKLQWRNLFPKHPPCRAQGLEFCYQLRAKSGLAFLPAWLACGQLPG